MMLKLYLKNGKTLWADKAEALRLQKEGKVNCVLREVELNMSVVLQNNNNNLQHLKWLQMSI